MLLDTREFSFCAALERLYPVIRSEHDALREHEFRPWPVSRAYAGTGRWLVFPFFLRDRPPELQGDFASERERCPKTVAALRALPGIDSAAFSRLEPGCHILPHVDKYFPDVVRVHLGLVVPAGAQARIGKLRAEWTEGRALLFDGQIEHEVVNAAATPRTVLLADFVLTADERATLERARAGR